jgi:hypothetical protein
MNIAVAQAFGLAVILLQLAIVLSSIAALTKKSVWALGLLLGYFRGRSLGKHAHWLFLEACKENDVIVLADCEPRGLPVRCC